MSSWENGTVNANELRVIGMSRSGNHAVIGWVMRQAAGRTCLLNCVQGKSNPYLTPRPVAPGDGERGYANYSDFDLESERRGVFSRKDWLVFSHEDDFLGNACAESFERRHDEFVGPSARRRDVLILRDPFNLFASRRRAGYGTVSEATAVRIWKQHAREFLRRTRWLRREPVFVSYNRWVTDPSYRRRLAEDLGLEFTDAGVDAVARCAGGSSFDGLAYDGRASRMKVFDRWAWYRDDPTFRSLFDEEVVALSEPIFGPPPALRLGNEATVRPRPTRHRRTAPAVRDGSPRGAVRGTRAR